MLEPVKAQTADSISVEGLEEVFISTVDEPTEDTGQISDQRWSLLEAAAMYDVTERTVRRWIKQGRIQAFKMDGPRGPEWRIQPESLEDNPGSIRTSLDIHPGSATTSLDTSHDNVALFQLVRELQIKLDGANHQLQSANFRLGYLESEVQVKDAQIKLLTDCQHNKPPWWHRFYSWFTSSRV